MDGDDAQDGDDCGDNEDDEKRMISSLVKMATLAMMRLMQLIGVTPISIDIGSHSQRFRTAGQKHCCAMV